MGEHDERRRNDDKRLDEITETVREIRNILQGENGVCVMLREVKVKGESCQKELTEYKETHSQTHIETKNNGFRIWDIVQGVSIIFLGVFEWSRNK